MSRAKEIYWIVSQPTAQVWDKIETLHLFRVETRILPDFQALARSYSQNRLNTIIITPDHDDTRFGERLQKLCNHPEYAGVRFILALDKQANETVQLASSLGFRDIISLDLTRETWIRRYIFAAAGHATDLADPPYQLTCKFMAAAHVPARISWMSEQELWLETRLLPPIGSHITLQGGLAQMLGVKHVSLQVMEHSNTHLHFRYSDALLCRWDIPAIYQDKKQKILTFIQEQKQAAPYRIYTVIRTQELRKELLNRLDPQKFQVAVALNKTNMIHEPRYISPDVILVEDRMCIGPNRASFREMLEGLDRPTHVLIIGPQATEDPYRNFNRFVTIKALTQLPPNFGAFLIERLGAPQSVRSGAVLIPKQHSMSFAQVVLPARLIRIHPEAAQLALQFPLGRFGICSIESPLFQQSLGRHVHIKVLRSQESQRPVVKDFPFESEGLLIDLEAAERREMAAYLAELYQNKITARPSKLAAASPVTIPESPPAPEESPLAQPVKVDTRAADVSINPSLEELQDRPSPNAEGSSWSQIAPEWKIALLTILLFGLLFGLIILMRSSPEEQAGDYIEQFRKFQEMHRSSSPTPSQ
jgi:hypothetical protein